MSAEGYLLHKTLPFSVGTLQASNASESLSNTTSLPSISIISATPGPSYRSKQHCHYYYNNIL